MVTYEFPPLIDFTSHNQAIWKPQPKEKIRPISSTTSGSISVFTFIPEEQTVSHYFDREILLLERAARVDDEEEFIRVVNQMDWSSRPVEHYVLAIDLALTIGAHLRARNLAHEGGLRFPDNSEMNRIARILAPVKTIRTDLPPEPESIANICWLKAHRHKYRGQWIAIKNGNLIASESSYKLLHDIIGSVKQTGILIIKA